MILGVLISQIYLVFAVSLWYSNAVQGKFAIVTLGCAKNTVDSEVMIDRLLSAGYRQSKPERADILLINTCAFIEAAKQEAIDTVFEYVRAREAGKSPEGQRIFVTGCLAQRYSKKLARLMPEVDAFVGVDEVGDIVRVVQTISEGKGEKVYCSKVAKNVPDYGATRYRLTPKHTAYVKIAEGCNHACAYCAIPRIRGAYRSRPTANIIREIRALTEGGTKEINLIAQDTTYYGLDRVGSGETLARLLREADKLPGDFWLRVLYTHPAHWSDELIAAFAECEKVVNYADIPLQHISDHILEEQRRKTDGAYIRQLLTRIRAAIPGIGLRTTLISGLPGESEQDHTALCDFVREFRFERAGVFPYSREEGTLAARMPGQVHHATKKRRANELNMLIAGIADEIGRACVGQKVRVLVDAPGIARGPWDAPDVDGAVHVDPQLPVGDFATVEITDSIAYELFAETAPRA